jgi:ferrous-iron efflux pump FieF
VQSDYQRLVKMAAICASCCAALMLTIKLIAWWITGSVSLLAAVVDSFVDIGASLTNLFILRFALQPPDDDHAFGHGKAESLGALAQSMFISGSAIFLILTGFQQLINPRTINTPDIGVVVMVISLVITIGLVSLQKWVVRKTASQAIKADMLHYQSDVFMNIAVLVALILSWYGFQRADAIFALIIGAYILYSAWHIGYDAIQCLLDRALPDNEREVIIDIIQSWPGVKGAHDLRTRQSGPMKFIQFHIELDDDLRLYDAHDIADRVEQALLERFPGSQVIIHQDPSSVVDLEKGHWQF